MKKQLKKIALAKETLRHLNGSDLNKAEGAAFPNSDVNTCVCHTVSCHPGLC